MAVNDYKITPYLEQARSRVTEQLKEKPVFDRYLQLMVDGSLEVQQVLKDLMQKRSIDTAEGVQLDILGEIVGQPRTLINADLFSFFGFMGHWQSDSYGSLDLEGVGSVWWDGEASSAGNITLNDDLYRLLIRAKIAKNSTRATPEDIMELANFVFDTGGSTIIDEGEAKYRLMIGRSLTRQEVGLLRYINYTASYGSKLLPKPIGVGVEYGSFDYDAMFAFQGVPNAKGYGRLVYSHLHDGSFLYDGSAIPALTLETDEDGVEIGGRWARLHEDI